MYTWGCSKLEEDNDYTRNGSSCGGFRIQSVRKGSIHKQRQQSRKDSANFSRKATSPSISKKVMLYVFVRVISRNLFLCSSFFFHSFVLSSASCGGNILLCRLLLQILFILREPSLLGQELLQAMKEGFRILEINL